MPAISASRLSSDSPEVPIGLVVFVAAILGIAAILWLARCCLNKFTKQWVPVLNSESAPCASDSEIATSHQLHLSKFSAKKQKAFARRLALSRSKLEMATSKRVPLILSAKPPYDSFTEAASLPRVEELAAEASVVSILGRFGASHPRRRPGPSPLRSEVLCDHSDEPVSINFVPEPTPVSVWEPESSARVLGDVPLNLLVAASPLNLVPKARTRRKRGRKHPRTTIQTQTPSSSDKENPSAPALQVPSTAAKNTARSRRGPLRC